MRYVASVLQDRNFQRYAHRLSFHDFAHEMPSRSVRRHSAATVTETEPSDSCDAYRHSPERMVLTERPGDEIRMLYPVLRSATRVIGQELREHWRQYIRPLFLEGGQLSCRHILANQILQSDNRKCSTAMLISHGRLPRMSLIRELNRPWLGFG